jgi:dTMP kinase
VPFVSFEGVDGSGKGTQVCRLATWLKNRGVSVVTTKEPDGGRIGLRVREILTAAQLAGKLSRVEELLLISAARYDHVRSIIQPALGRGDWVVCDRFYDSTFALQMFGSDIPEKLFSAVTEVVVGELRPDLTIILDIPVELQIRRLAEEWI